ncbi:MAG: ABC transporter, fused permease protein [uncultured Gemmatimonadetes bacterium]|uniref:ABC transporter, fused permease protein n=1 Tax=uncultured Gemmatimonadota bacterium TaxID=203437 RepID=A0A6J4LG29_9BACT|nr:MAG: ABC transporter, fused permease protein [uncultured Gemmatimonadota bacterium]
MKRISPLAALAWRESRFARRRLLLFLSSISLGVAALVATQSFAANLAAGVRDESRSLLGADVGFSSNRRFGPRTVALLDSLRKAGTPVAGMTSFASVALLERTGGARLSQVRAVEPGYPFYGEIRTEPAGAWPALSRGREAVADPALLTALDARIGDSISLGEARFRVAGVIRKIPGDVGISSAFAPRVYIPARFLGETQLLRFGSRAEYDAFVRLPAAGAAEALVKAYRSPLRAERVRARTAQEQQRSLDEALGRLGNFLGLVGTFALLLGGIGVASSMGAYMAQKRETVAALRCLGATARQVIAIYLLQAAAMGFAGAAIGAAMGVSVQWVLPRLLAGLLPVTVSTAVDPAALATGVGIGVWVASVFALLPLLATRRISPLQAIRRRVEAGGDAPRRRDVWTWAAWLLLAASVVGLVMLQAGDVVVGAGFAGGIAAALAGLWSTAWLATRATRAARVAGFRYPVRQGIANLHRPGNQTRVVVLALGFGVFLLATLYLTQHNLLRPLRVDAESRGNLLLFDVQGDQEAGVRQILEGGGTRTVQRAPIVPMRIHSINGRTAARLAPSTGGEDAEGERETRNGERGRPEGWALRREYRSTFRDHLIGSEKLAEGKLWAPGGGGARGGLAEVSIDGTITEDLAVELGDTIVWDVQGVRIATRITSIRNVDWQRLEPNFFAVFPTRVLRSAPQTWVLLARAPDAAARARVQRDVVRRYSNVAVLDLTEVQAAVDEVLGRVAAVIRFLAGFSVATGFIVLLGAVLTSRLQRIRESVLLRTLGATRGQIASILFAEYAVMGALASVVGIGLAVGGGWALARFLFELPYSVPVLPLLVLAAAVTALAAGVGVWASREVFRHTPLEALREE